MLLLFAAVPAGAAATAWTGLGGGPGRSGHDAFDHGATTNVTASWSQTATAEQDVVAGPVISDGVFSAQRVVYGTALDALHVQMLSSGMEVGPQAGTGVDDGGLDGDTFGAGDAVISPVIASSPSAPGQVYAMHNDDNQGGANDIALAQIDLATGALVQDEPVPNTDGYELQSSPLLTEPDAGGDASLFFVASDGVTPRLFRLDISDVRTTSAEFALTASSTAVAGANAQASPALVYLNDLAGVPTPYVAVGTSGTNFLETYAVSDFAAGPAASGVSGTGQTPSVPLTSDGLLPGAPGSGMDTSPFIYLAAEESSLNRVHRLEQFGNSDTLDVVSSDFLGGVPAPALAVSKRVGADPADGVVAYTTDVDLYLLNTDLSFRAEYSPSGIEDFGRTTAALSDDLVFAMLDDGTQKVLRASDATEVSPTEFTENSLQLGIDLRQGPTRSGRRTGDLLERPGCLRLQHPRQPAAAGGEPQAGQRARRRRAGGRCRGRPRHPRRAVPDRRGTGRDRDQSRVRPLAYAGRRALHPWLERRRHGARPSHLGGEGHRQRWPEQRAPRRPSSCSRTPSPIPIRPKRGSWPARGAARRTPRHAFALTPARTPRSSSARSTNQSFARAPPAMCSRSWPAVTGCGCAPSTPRGTSTSRRR